MKNKLRISYTIINHLARKELRLTMNEYAFLDTVYNLSDRPVSPYPGWCYASKETLGEILGLTRQSIYDLINRLVARKCLRKDETTRYLQVGIPDWRSKIDINSKYVKIPYNNSQGSLQSSKESLQNNSKATLLNKDNSNKEDKKDVDISITTPTANIDPLKILEIPDIQSELEKLPEHYRLYRYFLKRFKKTPYQVRLTEGRAQKILERLQQYPFDDILTAIYNASLSDFHNGNNKDGWKITLEWLMDKDERIEQLRDLEIDREI